MPELSILEVLVPGRICSLDNRNKDQAVGVNVRTAEVKINEIVKHRYLLGFLYLFYSLPIF
jgi:hypothetical protein